MPKRKAAEVPQHELRRSTRRKSDVLEQQHAATAKRAAEDDEAPNGERKSSKVRKVASKDEKASTGEAKVSVPNFPPTM